MKNLYRIYWCSLFLFFFFPVAKAQAEDPSEAVFWNEVLTNESLIQIAKSLRESTRPWPQINAIDNAPKWEINLIMRLHGIIQKSFNRNSALQLDEAKAYLQIADVLSKADGYSNVLLADSIYKLMIYYASQSLASSFDNITELESVITEMMVPPLIIKDRLKSFANDDPNLMERLPAIDEIGESDNLYVISQKLLSRDGREYVWTWSEDLTFTHLMEKPSGLGLTFRIAQTEMLATVSLKGLLEFIKQGGTLSELDPADVKRFEKRMSNAKGDYRYPPLGIRRLSVDGPIGVLMISTDPNTKRVFLRTALE